MPPQVRSVIVVGAGVIGVCAARALAKRGVRVTVFDSGKVAGAASFGNAGLLSLGHLPIPRPGVVGQALKWMFNGDSPLYIQPRLDPGLFKWLWLFRAACGMPCLEANMVALANLSRGAREMFDEIHAESSEGGPPAFFYDRRGYMEAYLTEAGWANSRKWGDLAARFGYPYEAVPGDELRRREPAFRDEVVGAVWHHHSAFCNPHALVSAAACLARRSGVEIREVTPVARLVVSGSRVTGVELTSGERAEADVTIIAAGPWSLDLTRPLGITFPFQPAKGYHRDIREGQPRLTTAAVLGEAAMVATPMGGFMRLAGTLEFSGLNLDMRRNRLEMLSAGVKRFLRGTETQTPAREQWEWVGMRPCTPDGLPVIGWAPRHEGLFLATGHAMLGLSQGPPTAKVVEACIVDGKPPFDISPMRVDRF